MVVGDTAVTVPFFVCRGKTETCTQYSASHVVYRILVCTSSKVKTFTLVIEELTENFQLCIFIFFIFFTKTEMSTFILGFLIITVGIPIAVMQNDCFSLRLLLILLAFQCWSRFLRLTFS